MEFRVARSAQRAASHRARYRQARGASPPAATSVHGAGHEVDEAGSVLRGAGFRAVGRPRRRLGVNRGEPLPEDRWGVSALSDRANHLFYNVLGGPGRPVPARHGGRMHPYAGGHAGEGRDDRRREEERNGGTSSQWGRASRSRGRGAVKPRRRRGVPPSFGGGAKGSRAAPSSARRPGSRAPLSVDPPEPPSPYSLGLEVAVAMSLQMRFAARLSGGRPAEAQR